MLGGLKFEIDDKGVKAKLDKLDALSADLTPAYEVVGQVLIRRIDLCFKLGIDPWGTPWAKLRFRKGKPLRDKGTLRASFSAKADATGVTVGTKLKYAPTHQFGAEIVPKNGKFLVFPGPGGRKIFAKKVNVPARPFLPLRKGSQTLDLPPTWSVSVVQALRAHFLKAIA